MRPHSRRATSAAASRRTDRRAGAAPPRERPAASSRVDRLAVLPSRSVRHPVDPLTSRRTRRARSTAVAAQARSPSPRPRRAASRRSTAPVCATNAVTTGKAPQASANPRSVWRRRRRARGCTRGRGARRATTSGRIQAVVVARRAIPIAHAAAVETTATAEQRRREIAVPSGRPWSSSSACAPSPSARKNASTVSPSTAQSTSARGSRRRRRRRGATRCREDGAA